MAHKWELKGDKQFLRLSKYKGENSQAGYLKTVSINYRPTQVLQTP